MAANDRKRRPAVTDPRAAEKRRSLLLMVGATAVVVVIAVGIGVWLIVSKEDKSSSTSASTAPPSVATSTGAYRVSGPSGTPKATLTLIEDFQCPACKQFEASFAEALTKIRSNPQVAVDYKPITFLDRSSTTNYSTRAANASACVAESTASKGDWSTWLKFHDALYAQQPPEQSAGLPDSTLLSIATDAGAPDSVKSCIDDGTYKKWTDAQTATVLAGDFQGTPQVELNGKQVQLATGDALISAVDAAVAG